MATRMTAAPRELSMDELMLVSGGDKKPAPGSTGSADLDKALDKMKNDILNGPLNQPIKWPS